MRFRLRKSFRLGPVRINFTERGYSSTSVKIGPWGWNSRTGRQHFNTPGPGSLRWGGKKRRR